MEDKSIIKGRGRKTGRSQYSDTTGTENPISDFPSQETLICQDAVDSQPVVQDMKQSRFNPFPEESKGRTACLECGEPIVYGRTDRKFCCDKCKNQYNNRRIKDSRNVKMRVWNVLERNYAILEGLLRVGMTSVPLSDLNTLGFIQDCSTTYRRVRGGHGEYQCFDISYYKTDTRIFGLRKSPSTLSSSSPDPFP